MASMNKITIIGRTGKDVELKQTTTGISVGNVSVAVEDWQKDESGEKQTDWFNVTLWKQKAEFAAQYLPKGTLVVVSGRMKSRKFTNKDGVNVTVWDLIADDIQGLTSKKDTEDTEGEAEARPLAKTASNGTKPVAATRKATVPAGDDVDESDPFADE